MKLRKKEGKLKRGIVLFFATTLTLIYFLYGFQKQKESKPQEKHEVEVRLVLVDVIVTKNGKFVKDLTKDDFELYEDGKRVPINSFELISFGERRVEITEERKRVKPPSVPRKKLVVLFDGINSWEKELKEGIEKIIDELTSLVKLGHEVMVLQLSTKKGIEILQSFTTNEELIRNAVSKASASVWQARQTLMSVMKFELGSPGYHVREYLFAEKRKFEATLGGILATLNMMKSLPGRKSILFVSAGIPDISTTRSVTIGGDLTALTPYTGTVKVNPIEIFASVKVFDPFNILEKKRFKSGDEAIKEMIRFANAHNISVYSLDPGTLTRSLFPEGTAEYVETGSSSMLNLFNKETFWKLQNSRRLSEDTGAVALKGADKYKNFRQVMTTDLNYYYQLSFYPKRKEADDKYHKIKVRVNRKGVDMRFRKGYTDYSEEEANKMLLISAFYNPSLFKGLPFEAGFIPFLTNSGKYEPWMSIALPAKEFFLDRFIEYAPKTFNLHIWTIDRENGEKAFGVDIKIPFNINLSFMNYMTTINYLCFYFKGPELNFGPNEYQTVFALFDSQTNEVGTCESSFSLPDFKENKEGAIINCVLGSISSNPDKGRKSFSLSQKDGSLEYGEIKFFPRVTKKFLQQEDAFVFMQIYLPEGRVEIQPEFQVSGGGDLSNRIEGELIAESWNKRSKVWSGIFKLNLGNLSVGDNFLKVGIPVSKEGAVISKEVKLTKLR